MSNEVEEQWLILHHQIQNQSLVECQNLLQLHWKIPVKNKIVLMRITISNGSRGLNYTYIDRTYSQYWWHIRISCKQSTGFLENKEKVMA